MDPSWRIKARKGDKISVCTAVTATIPFLAPDLFVSFGPSLFMDLPTTIKCNDTIFITTPKPK